MKQPDRIARVVERDFAKDLLRSGMPMGEVRYRVDRLLRREAAYQRARVRRIVTRERKRFDGQYINVDDLLAALTPGRIKS